MHQLPLILFITLGSLNVFSQEIKGTVKDNSNLKAVPFASVYYSKAEVGTYSDSTGNFSVQKIPGDTLVISAIGFEKYLIPIENNNTNNSNNNTTTATNNKLNISLIPLTINLNEVVIKGRHGGMKKGKSLRLGNLSSKTELLVSGSKGRTVAYLVKNEAGIKAQIKSIQFGVNSKHVQGHDALVRAHLYTVDSNTGKPGVDLLVNGELVKVRKEDTKLIVDLDHFGIELPAEGVFIALEWLDLNPYYTRIESLQNLLQFI